MTDALVQPLYTLLQSNPVSVEILPSGWTGSAPNPHEPFEFTERHLGIPKKAFYGVYMVAIQRFNALLTMDTVTLDEEKAKEMQTVTGVILLANPGHFTALNRRKELVMSGRLSEEDELRLTAAWQLRSEGAKSSILWHHRRWLLRRKYGSRGVKMETSDTLDGCSLPVPAFSNELAVAITACEIYPRNYHAWLHRIHCITSITRRTDGSSVPDSYAQILRAEEFMIKKWTESHIGDYTAMQYLCQLYSLMEAHGIQHIQIHSDTGEVVGENSTNVENKSPFSPIAHSIELVRRFPTHEALWYYLRAAYAPQLSLGKSRPNIEELKGLDKEKLKSFERWVSGLKQTIT